MAYKIEGEICPVCKAYLFDEDDVVFCPICGAPHHRDCYASIGHCAFEADHGTDKQYTPRFDDETAEPETDTLRDASQCPRCGRETDSQTLFCPYCGYDLSGRQQEQYAPSGFAPFIDPYGGVPHDGSVKIEGENIDDVRRFVFSNTHRYLPVFARLHKGSLFSWNWAAFLLPHCWLFFRKHYKAGIIAMTLMLVSSLCSLPLSTELSALISSGSAVVTTQQEQIQLILSLLPKAGTFAIVMQVIGFVLGLGTMIFFGIMGDWIYRGHAVASIKEINITADSEEKEEAYMRKGGISVWAFMLAYIVYNFIPKIISTLI